MEKNKNNQITSSEFGDEGEEIRSGFKQLIQNRGYREAVLSDFTEEENVSQERGYQSAILNDELDTSFKYSSVYILGKLSGILTGCTLEKCVNNDILIDIEALKKEIQIAINEYYQPPEKIVNEAIHDRFNVDSSSVNNDCSKTKINMIDCVKLEDRHIYLVNKTKELCEKVGISVDL